MALLVLFAAGGCAGPTASTKDRTRTAHESAAKPVPPLVFKPERGKLSCSATGTSATVPDALVSRLERVGDQGARLVLPERGEGFALRASTGRVDLSDLLHDWTALHAEVFGKPSGPVDAELTQQQETITITYRLPEVPGADEYRLVYRLVHRNGGSCRLYAVTKHGADPSEVAELVRSSTHVPGLDYSQQPVQRKDTGPLAPLRRVATGTVRVVEGTFRVIDYLD